MLLIPLAAAQSLSPAVEADIRALTFPAEEIYDILPVRESPVSSRCLWPSRSATGPLALRRSFDAAIAESVWLFAESGEASDSP
jgi:hypothetical protein